MPDKSPKTPSQSRTIMTELVLPNDTNALGNLMGGNLLKWMDICGAICARRHAQVTCVTAGADNISFDCPVKLAEVLTITAVATRVFTTSMEVHIAVYSEDPNINSKRKCNEAYFTFVGLNTDNQRVKLPPLTPETVEEQQQYDKALRRREMRLILAGRMKANESKSLKSLFFDN